MKNNIFIITSHYKDQDSVNEITKNLISIYKKIGRAKIIAIEDFQILPKEISSVVVVHPHVFTNSNLKKIFNALDSSTKIMIHVFGDFMRKSSYYISLQEELMGKNVSFISASTCYQKLISRALIRSQIDVIPFPLSDQIFFPSLKLREKARKKFDIHQNEKVLIYTGRLSPQKNIKLLIECFARASKNLVSPTHLFLVGNFDSVEMATFYDKKYIPGEYFAEINQIIQSKKVENIHFIPRVDRKQLNALYNMADLFVSLSLYHDEDFGYSPIEALMCEKPILLTRWGGYKDLLPLLPFKDKTNLIPVSYVKGSLRLNENIISKKIHSSLERKNAKINSNKFKKNYCAKTIGSKIAKELKTFKTFSGFSQKFIDFSLGQLVHSLPKNSEYKYFYSGFWDA